LRRFPQGRGVDAQESQCRLVAEEIRGHRGALGLGDETVQRLLNGDDTLVERQGLQLGSGQVQPLQRAHRRARPGSSLRQPGRQLFGGLFDLTHGNTGQLASPCQHLQAFHCGFQRGSHIGLRPDGV